MLSPQQNPMLLDPKADREEVRQYLNDLLEQMESVQQKSKALKDRQKELKVRLKFFKWVQSRSFVK